MPARMMRTWMGAAILAICGGLLITPAASADEHPDCAIWAETPRLDAGIVIGTGVRDGCVQRRTITVLVREDRRLLGDRTLGEVTRSGVINISLPAVWDCQGFESKTVYTEIRTSAGGKAQSPRRGITCNEF